MDLKTEEVTLIAMGKSFQSLWADTENARSPLHLYFNLGIANIIWLDAAQSVSQSGMMEPYHLKICKEEVIF